MDFGSEWCVRSLPGISNDESGNPRRLHLPVQRRVMLVVMVAQLALHTLFWPSGGEDGEEELFMFSVLWRFWKHEGVVWGLAREVFASDKMEPICTTYYSRPGRDIFDVLAGIFKGCAPTEDGCLATNANGPTGPNGPTGVCWNWHGMFAAVSGKTPTRRRSRQYQPDSSSDSSLDSRW